MTEQPTCGQGLAARSTLPTTLGTLFGALADVLEYHTRSLDPSDEDAQREENAYRSLVARHRDAADALRATGGEMASYRDLPMAPHDVSVLMSDEAVDVFARAVAVERELAELLEKRLGEDEAMLAQMRGEQR